METFVFDWSGVISNDAPPVYIANMMLLEDNGHDRISFERWKELSALTAAGFLKNCGIDADEKETYETYRRYFNEIVTKGNKPEIIPGAKGALESLSKTGRRLLILSSHPAQSLREEMRRYGVEDLFEHVIGSVTDKASGLRGICQGINTKGIDVLYWGDTIYDVFAAKGAGVSSGVVASEYAYHSRERLEAVNPDFNLPDISWMIGV